ncbi:hypothetical protein KAU43_00520 [candidate division WOR-3 bacterium]|jgi:hypothetical protein|nr:hypothetical protein [candidate division WOR-3 bacterium]
MKRKRIEFLFIILILFMLSTGCIHYTFSSGSIDNVSTVFIEPVKNSTLQYGLENSLESDTKTAFIQDGRLNLVNSDGDILIKITVKNFKKEPFDYDASGTVKSYKVSITVKTEINKKGIEKSIYNGNISEWETDDISTFDLQNLIDKVSKEIASDIVDKVFSHW